MKFYERVRVVKGTSDKIRVAVRIIILTAQSEIRLLLNKL